jgi:membrane-associated phospholipid phosphatase
MSGFFHSIVVAITDLGDSAVLIVETIVISLQLAWARYWCAVWVLWLSLIGAAAAIGLLKLLFIGCQIEVLELAIHSPSGHSALSASVYLTLAAIVSRQLKGWAAPLPFVGAVLLIASIAATRVALHMHSLDEALLGLAIGGGVAALCLTLLSESGRPGFRFRGIVATVVLVAVVMDGARLPAEAAIRYMAAFISERTPFCRDIRIGRQAERGGRERSDPQIFKD